jgi:hypothetical protein
MQQARRRLPVSSRYYAGSVFSKYNSNGQLVWQKNDVPFAYSTIFDTDDNLYVGVMGQPGFILKYNSDGSPVSSMLFEKAGYAYSSPLALAFGPDGALYVVGTVSRDNTSRTLKMLLCKYLPDGSPVWCTGYPTYFEPQDMAIGQNGDVYLAGTDFERVFLSQIQYNGVFMAELFFLFRLTAKWRSSRRINFYAKNYYALGFPQALKKKYSPEAYLTDG